MVTTKALLDPWMTLGNMEKLTADIEAEFPLMTWVPGEGSRLATPAEVSAYKSGKIHGRRADWVVMDDPHVSVSPPPEQWAVNLDLCETERRILAHYAAETEKAAAQALLYGSSIHRIESDGTWAPIPPDEAFEPKGGESLFDMFQRKLFDREADKVEASAEPVYLSQFPDSVFNPTDGCWSGAGKLIDTAD